MCLCILYIHPHIPSPNATDTNELHPPASCDYTKYGLVYTAILDYVKECCGELICITMWSTVYTAVIYQM